MFSGILKSFVQIMSPSDSLLLQAIDLHSLLSETN